MNLLFKEKKDEYNQLFIDACNAQRDYIRFSGYDDGMEFSIFTDDNLNILHFDKYLTKRTLKNQLISLLNNYNLVIDKTNKKGLIKFIKK